MKKSREKLPVRSQGPRSVPSDELIGVRGGTETAKRDYQKEPANLDAPN